MALAGIWSRPFVDLTRYFPDAPLALLDDEITMALTHLPLDYTGGSHKTMGIVPASLAHDAYVDYGQAIRAFSRDEFVRFAALADEAWDIDPDERNDHEYGEERAFALSRRQMLFLKYRHKVYFPWKAYFEIIPNHRWEEKASPYGKAFAREALLYMPRTVAFIEQLPFVHIGSAKLLGLEANDHGTVHRDGVPADKPDADHFVTFCPRGDKRFFLWDEEAKTKAFSPSRFYWFNDSDYHGVEADPFFRYSVRVDGVFTPDFVARLRQDHAA